MRLLRKLAFATICTAVLSSSIGIARAEEGATQGEWIVNNDSSISYLEGPASTRGTSNWRGVAFSNNTDWEGLPDSVNRVLELLGLDGSYSQQVIAIPDVWANTNVSVECDRTGAALRLCDSSGRQLTAVIFGPWPTRVDFAATGGGYMRLQASPSLASFAADTTFLVGVFAISVLNPTAGAAFEGLGDLLVAVIPLSLRAVDALQAKDPSLALAELTVLANNLYDVFASQLLLGDSALTTGLINRLGATAKMISRKVAILLGIAEIAASLTRSLSRLPLLGEPSRTATLTVQWVPDERPPSATPSAVVTSNPPPTALPPASAIPAPTFTGDTDSGYVPGSGRANGWWCGSSFVVSAPGGGAELVITCFNTSTRDWAWWPDLTDSQRSYVCADLAQWVAAGSPYLVSGENAAWFGSPDHPYFATEEECILWGDQFWVY